MKRFFFPALLLLLSNFLFGQTGKITGNVINSTSGLVLSGATVMLLEKSKIVIADQNGSFTFGKLEAGVYSVKCSYTGYKEKIIDSVIVKNGEVTSITVSLENKKDLDEVVVTSKSSAKKETIVSLLAAQKNQASVSDFISAEQIRKTPDRSTGDVIKRVSGASIQDDRFAIIRGLSDRYNAAFINGAPLPSTESDRKAFAFDIFPSAILDNLIIYKTATPDKTGEFAGGIIDITTKSILQKSFSSISYGITYNSLSTGNTRFYSENKGKKDWIGIDDGTRAMPAGIPSAQDIKNILTPAQKGELAKLFGNYRWGILKSNTRPNFNFQLTKGFNIEKNQREFLGALFSVNYNRNYTFNEGERNSFDQYDFAVPYYAPVQRGKFRDSIYNDEVIVSVLGNISIKLNGRNNIYWKNNLSINTDNKIVKRKGVPDATDDPTAFNLQAVRWFTSNQIFSSQLNGEHLVGALKTKINWLAAFSNVKRDIPNLSRTVYQTDSNVTYINGTFSLPPSQTTGSGTMFFSSSDENIKSIKADITQPYTFIKNSQNSLKLGAGYQHRKREFISRTLGLSPYDQGGVSFDNSLKALPEDQIFLPSHLGKLKDGSGGFLLNDGTIPNSNYDASSTTTHAYIMNDQRLYKKFRFIYGVRMESFNQKLNTIQDKDTININTVVTDFLPSANFIYAVTPKINIRLSYAATINRPEFRELAPFLFLEYVTAYTYEGTSTLKRALIKNYDFRFEFFPGKAQLFSVSAFYKDFKNPIELISLPNVSSQAKYINTSSAKVYGLEAEFRTMLSTMLGISNEKSFLNKFTLSANAAYIKSSISLKDTLFGFGPDQLFSNRSLQGQSPYIINGSVGFNDEITGLTSTLSVNRVGDRIAIAGTYNIPDIYEKARTMVDFQIAKTFLKGALELKFNAKDMLSQNISFYFDFDRSKSFSDKDRYFSSTISPKAFSFSATLKF
jgi:TonB dependent receptor/CarboxypepD_reg-like domain/TonB-dependent Receptor Plug Domain